MLTLSLANWMELPGLKLKDWMREKRRYSEQQALSICFNLLSAGYCMVS